MHAGVKDFAVGKAVTFPLWTDNSSFSVTPSFLSTFVLMLPLSSTYPFTPWLVHCSNWVLNGQFISAVATSPEARGARNKGICSLSTSVYPSVWSPNTTAQLISCSFSFNLLQNWSCWLKMCFNTNPQEQHTSTQTLKINVPQQKPSRTTYSTCWIFTIWDWCNPDVLLTRFNRS